MLRCDALVIGGGPAGSTCARALTGAGWQVVVLDRARFPRDKVCAGWLTPQVLDLLELQPAEYRATGLTFQEITGFRTGLIEGRLLETRYPSIVSYAIRRCEFDDFLLRRSHAVVRDATPVASIRQAGDRWIVNDAFEAPVLIGAGGHFCPVARHLDGNKPGEEPVVAQEAEFRIDRSATTVESEVPELFFCRDLEGYAWCVRKGDFVNVGIGRRGSLGFLAAQRDFVAYLERTRKATGASEARWRGHAYFASGAGTRPLVSDGALVIGDAAGLAYPESGEGIRPAIESGLRAAQTLVGADGVYSRERLQPYEAAMRRIHPRSQPTPEPMRKVVVALGRALLQSRPFARHVVLNRWFLRSGADAA